MSSQNCLVMIGGWAGVGKTTLGRDLARRTGFALVDKDTVAERMVDALLVAKGSLFGARDRHSAIYLNEVRPLEYAAFLDVVRENLQAGVSVIAVATLSREMTDREWRRQWEETVGVAVHYIWVQVDEETMRRQLIGRGCVRDEYKLAHWEEYVQSIRDVRPCEPYLEAGANGGEAAIAAFHLAER